MSTNTQIEHNGKRYNLTSRAWWLDGRIESPRGDVVARVAADSANLRYRTDEELAVAAKALTVTNEIPNKYHYSIEYTGRPVSVMLDLTEADIEKFFLNPGVLRDMSIVDGTRPKQHEKPATPAAKHAKFIDALQNEGY